jgi:glycosyltransferase involved in cell wall biosynthesis
VQSDFSIVIPTYNSSVTLRKLLESLVQQTVSGFEVIVVDDASTDDTAAVVAEYGVRYERLTANQGPATARNRGAALTQGAWLVFADADTIFLPDTMEQIESTVRESDADALVGTYAGIPANEGFVPRFKALWEEVTIDMVLQPEGTGRGGSLARGGLTPYSTWAPRPGLVRREAFNVLGGFSATFRGADLEDMELGYRLAAQGYRTYFAPSIRIRHHYPATLYAELRPFARRCAIWMRMRSGSQGLDRAGEGSPKQAATHLLGFAAFGLVVIGILLPVAWILAAICIGAYFALNGEFLRHAFRQEGLWFTVRAAALCWLHTIVMGFAAGYGLLTRPRKG